MAEPNVPDVILTLLEQIHNDMSAMRQELTDHIATEPAEWAKILSDLQAKAFPGGDPEGHRKAHEDEMATIAARAAARSRGKSQGRYAAAHHNVEEATA